MILYKSKIQCPNCEGCGKMSSPYNDKEGKRKIRTTICNVCSGKGYIAGNIKISVNQEEKLQALENKFADGWIPINEKLPDKEGHYLVSLKHKDGVETDVDLLHYDDEEGFWFHDNMQNIWWEIVAWKLLPIPYEK